MVKEKGRQADEFPVDKLSVVMRNAMLSEQRAIGDKVLGLWIVVGILIRVTLRKFQTFW
jgi:hypothetical protein